MCAALSGWINWIQLCALQPHLSIYCFMWPTNSPQSLCALDTQYSLLFQPPFEPVPNKAVIFHSPTELLPCLNLSQSFKPKVRIGISSEDYFGARTAGASHHGRSWASIQTGLPEVRQHWSCDFSFLVLILLVAATGQKKSFLCYSVSLQRESLNLFCLSLCSKRKQCEVPSCAEFIHSLVHPWRLFGNIFPVNRLSSGIWAEHPWLMSFPL